MLKENTAAKLRQSGPESNYWCFFSQKLLKMTSIFFLLYRQDGAFLENKGSVQFIIKRASFGQKIQNLF